MKLRTLHLIVTGVSLVVVNTLIFLLLTFFFNIYSEQLARAASQNMRREESAEEIYLVIREAANNSTADLTVSIIAVLAFGMFLYYIFSDIFLHKFILNPLIRIGDKAGQIIEKPDNLGEQIPTPMFQEMQRVTITFNEMSQALQSQMQSLEEKVKQRTEELNRAKENIEHLANHDPLTGLPNRRLFNEHTSQAIKLASRKKTKFALLMIDLNRFKRINDTYGHMLGDQVLQKVAARFSEGLRESDLISRWGGDEFAILAFEILNKSDVVKIITRLFNAFKLPINVNGQPFTIEMSIGAAIFPKDGENQQRLFRNADAALYQAKNRQTHRSYCFAEDSLQDSQNNIASD